MRESKKTPVNVQKALHSLTKRGGGIPTTPDDAKKSNTNIQRRQIYPAGTTQAPPNDMEKHPKNDPS